MANAPNDEAILALARALASQGATTEAIARTQEGQGAALEALVAVVGRQQTEGAELAEAVRSMAHQLGRMTIRQAEMMAEAKKRQEAALGKLKDLTQGRSSG